MGTTYGPSDRDYRGVSNRSGRDAKVVPLNRYQPQLSQRTTPRAVRQGGEPAKLLPWRPRGSAPATEPQAGTYAGRRRRRPSPLKQWMPTIVFGGIIAGLALLLLAVRMMLASSTPAPAPVTAQTAPVEQVAVAPQVREPLGAPLPTAVPAAPTTTIKFASKPIEPSYTVTANDNLWSIAQRNRTTAEAIQAINNLPERATLSIGQRLVMP